MNVIKLGNLEMYSNQFLSEMMLEPLASSLFKNTKTGENHFFYWYIHFKVNLTFVASDFDK